MGKRKPQSLPPDRPRFGVDEKIADILDRDPRVQGVLHEYGLPCEDCVVKDFETLADGCIPLGIKASDIVARLNALPPASGP